MYEWSTFGCLYLQVLHLNFLKKERSPFLISFGGFKSAFVALIESFQVHLLQCREYLPYYFPVLPKRPSPRELSLNSFVSTISGCSIF